MFQTLMLCTAWFMKLDHPPTVLPTRLTYALDPSICYSVSQSFRDHAGLFWDTYGCNQVKSIIRGAFDEWGHNSQLQLHEIELKGEVADIILLSTHLTDSNIIAQATTYRVGSRKHFKIEFDGDRCWYVDQKFCSSVNGSSTYVSMFLIITWTISIAIGCVIQTWKAKTKPTKYFVYFLICFFFITSPLIFFVTIRTCGNCFDFRYVIMHEIGHVLGFSHTDSPEPQMCGCGNFTNQCDSPVSGNVVGIMHSQLITDSKACLSKNDVDGLRTHFGGDCDAPITCYDESSDVGGYRMGIGSNDC